MVRSRLFLVGCANSMLLIRAYMIYKQPKYAKLKDEPADTEEAVEVPSFPAPPTAVAE